MFRIKWPRKKQKKSNSAVYNDNWSDYYQKYYPHMNHKLSGKKSRRRILTRTLVTVLILMILLAAREMQLPLGQQVRDNVRYLLTAEWNFEPMLQGAVRVASQIANWENPMFNSWPNVGPAHPVTGENMGVEGMWVPVSGKIVREFGFTRDPLDGLERFHPGVDIEAKVGTPVRAAMDGQVVKVGKDTLLGEYVLLNHGEGNYTMYAGLTAIAFEEGQWVSAGQEIGAVGEQSDVPGEGLHFEMRENNELVDPLKRLNMGE